MKLAIEIVQQLGMTGLLLLLSFPMILLTLLVFLKGFSWNGKAIFNGVLKKSDCPREIDDFYFMEKVDDSSIGFEVPRPNVIIFGNLWNKEHSKVYRMLEDRWTSCTKADLTQCNITPSLISILEEKVKQFGELTIYMTTDQEKLLAYLKQFPGIKFEVR